MLPRSWISILKSSQFGIHLVYKPLYGTEMVIKLLNIVVLQLPIAVECDASHEQMSGHRAVVEEILQTFCQICLRAVTAQRDVSLTVFYCLWPTCDHDYKLECSTANCLPFIGIANGLFFSTKLCALLCHCGSVPSSVAWLFTNMMECRGWGAGLVV